MARAGVKMLFVGQESGDQRMLDIMRKGTKLVQVRPAIEALAKHGVSAQFGFIHGYPGETGESIANSRRLLATLNDGFEDRPVALMYAVTPFGLFVTLDDYFVDGLVHISELGRDYYEFDATRHMLLGSRTKKRYRLADRMKVKLVRVDLDSRKIDFVPA